VILSVPYKDTQLFISAFPRLCCFKAECFYSIIKSTYYVHNDPVTVQNTSGSLFICKVSGRTDNFSDFCKTLSRTEHKLAFEN